MNVIIVGCGRVGAYLAGMLDRDGHQVTVVDLERHNLRRLPPGFSGTSQVGDAVDQDDLKAAGILEADAFVAVEEGDSRNAMAAHIAKDIFGVSKVLCRICDPALEEMYREMGLETVSATKTEAHLLMERMSS